MHVCPVGACLRGRGGAQHGPWHSSALPPCPKRRVCSGLCVCVEGGGRGGGGRCHVAVSPPECLPMK